MSSSKACWKCALTKEPYVSVCELFSQSRTQEDLVVLFDALYWLGLLCLAVLIWKLAIILRKGIYHMCTIWYPSPHYAEIAEMAKRAGTSCNTFQMFKKLRSVFQPVSSTILLWSCMIYLLILFQSEVKAFEYIHTLPQTSARASYKNLERGKYEPRNHVYGPDGFIKGTDYKAIYLVNKETYWETLKLNLPLTLIGTDWTKISTIPFNAEIDTIIIIPDFNGSTGSVQMIWDLCELRPNAKEVEKIRHIGFSCGLDVWRFDSNAVIKEPYSFLPNVEEVTFYNKAICLGGNFEMWSDDDNEIGGIIGYYWGAVSWRTHIRICSEQLELGEWKEEAPKLQIARCRPPKRWWTWFCKGIRGNWRP